MSEINNKINFSSPTSKSTTHDDGYRLAIAPNPTPKPAEPVKPKQSNERYLFRHGNSIFSIGRAGRKTTSEILLKPEVASVDGPKIPASIPLPLVPALIAKQADESVNQSVDKPVAQALYRSKAFLGVLATLFSMALAGSHIISSSLTQQSNQLSEMIGVTHSLFQSKAAQQDEYKIALRELDVRLAATPYVSEKARDLILDGINEYRNYINLSESNEASGDGKEQLLNRAKALESERSAILAQASWITYAKAILGISIALIFIAMMTNVTTFTALSILCEALGMVALTNGLHLFWVI